jgi:predicted ATPase
VKQFEAFRLDTVNECLWHNSAQIVLPPKPFAVLRYLVEHPQRLVSHDELLDALWPETYVQPQVLRTYVLDLRKALGDDAGQPRFIQTLPKRGYSFIAQVSDNSETEVALPLHTAAKSDASEISGRAGELAQLDALLGKLAAGQRNVVLVAGEAGIGKTALLDAFSRRVEHAQAAAIARGQCVQGVGSQENLYPVLEALGHLCASPDGERACRTLARIAPAWLARGWASNGHATVSADIKTPERTLGDLSCALEELSLEKPLILIFEDVEWADESTLHLISALARRRAPARLMVLCTSRPRKGTALQELRQDLLLRKLCVEIVLGPLARPAISELLSRELGTGALPAGLDRFIYQRAEGNPLFATAILEHLRMQRVLVRDIAANGEEWKLIEPLDQAEAGVPDQLARTIEMDLARLTSEEQCALEAGSLMNIAFPAWAVAAALGKSVAEAEETCDRLAQQLYFLGRAGQDELPDGTRSSFYVFSHQIYRDVIYQRQPATRRDERHIRIANRLRVLFAEREADVAREIAIHYEAGGAWRDACEALRLAAARAQRRNAFADAAELLERALLLAENLHGTDRESSAAITRTQLMLVQSSFEDSGLAHQASQKA